MSDLERVRPVPRNANSAAPRAKGWLVALLGLLVLLASYQFPQDGLLATLAVALRPVAWLALLLGLVYVGFRHVMRPLPGAQGDGRVPDDPELGMTRPSVLQALGVGRGGTAAELEPSFVVTIAVHPEAGPGDDAGEGAADGACPGGHAD